MSAVPTFATSQCSCTCTSSFFHPCMSEYLYYFKLLLDPCALRPGFALPPPPPPAWDCQIGMVAILDCKTCMILWLCGCPLTAPQLLLGRMGSPVKSRRLFIATVLESHPLQFIGGIRKHPSATSTNLLTAVIVPGPGAASFSENNTKAYQHRCCSLRQRSKVS